MADARSLNGVRVWLSGAVPEPSEVSTEHQNAVAGFIRRFARTVFSEGGHIVHGSHPTVVPLLLEEAERAQSHGARRDCLTLAVSRYWSTGEMSTQLDVWRDFSVVYETPAIGGPAGRDESLRILRGWMAARADVAVVLGGRAWPRSAARPGVALESELAIDAGLPVFLLGGFGGAARDYITTRPDTVRALKNGLGPDENMALALEPSVDTAADRICRQLERLPLVKGQGTDGLSFRILALDGGGLKGTFTAAVLAALEKQTKSQIVDHFDLIAGTSTGGILAIGLGLGLSASEVLDFYRGRGPTIFPVTRLRSKPFKMAAHLVWPKHNQEILYKELADALYPRGTPVPLKHSKCRLVIPAYHAVAGASHQFRTPHHPDLLADADVPAADVALATAAAPTYFSAAKIATMVAESSYFDGGVWANAPVLAAIIEAVCFLGVPLERLDILSVGTTEEPFSVRWQRRAGLLGWLWKRRILDLLMNVQQESSLRLSQHLVGTPRFLRVNTMTPAGSYSLDSPKEIGDLAELGGRIGTDPHLIGQVKSRFLNGLAVLPWRSYA